MSRITWRTAVPHKICRENGITHRLTKIHSPTTTGKIERLHQTLQFLSQWLARDPTRLAGTVRRPPRIRPGRTAR